MLGYEVHFVYNYTDIDDKILDSAQKNLFEKNLSSETIKNIHKASSLEKPILVAQAYIREFQKDLKTLGLYHIGEKGLLRGQSSRDPELQKSLQNVTQKNIHTISDSFKALNDKKDSETESVKSMSSLNETQDACIKKNNFDCNPWATDFIDGSGFSNLSYRFFEPSEIQPESSVQFASPDTSLETKPLSMIQFIQELEEKGHTYVVDKSVYFSVESFRDYGSLSSRKLDQLETGTRVVTEENKKHKADFVLWKAAKKGEVSWDSPWGKGRPGWHIECSTMIRFLLGEQIDIHGGGLDLLFPHHENELAQTECLTGKAPFVRYWMHNNMINFEDKKMSKSLGNIIFARDFMQTYTGEVLKYIMLSSHYRSEISWNEKQIQSSIASLAKFYSALSVADKILKENSNGEPWKENGNPFQEHYDRIVAALDEDFNTPVLFAELFQVVTYFHKLVSKGVGKDKVLYAFFFKNLFLSLGSPLSLFQKDPCVYLKTLDDFLLKIKGLRREDIDKRVEERVVARETKNFKLSDEIRDDLIQKGISLQDLPDGTTEWEVAK